MWLLLPQTQLRWWLAHFSISTCGYGKGRQLALLHPVRSFLDNFQLFILFRWLRFETYERFNWAFTHNFVAICEILHLMRLQRFFDLIRIERMLFLLLVGWCESVIWNHYRILSLWGDWKKFFVFHLHLLSLTNSFNICLAATLLLHLYLFNKPRKLE